jgi:hypothetical protein
VQVKRLVEVNDFPEDGPMSPKHVVINQILRHEQIVSEVVQRRSILIYGRITLR